LKTQLAGILCAFSERKKQRDDQNGAKAFLAAKMTCKPIVHKENVAINYRAFSVTKLC
jgi:hypothetical protein